MFRKDRMNPPREAFKMGLGMMFHDGRPGLVVEGHVFFEMRDARSGRLLHKWDRKNLIVLDAGILVARLLKDPAEPAHGINMLAIGTGGTGALLSPDAPDPRQRKLNAEIERKAFSNITFRNEVGAAVSIPTNVIDFTVSFGEAEAVGPLNEMSLMSTISDNPGTKAPNPDSFPTRDTTVDLTQFDTIANYLSFAVVSKPSTAILTITWRIST